MARVTLVGGGYSGAATAVQLTNAAGHDVTIVEPRAQAGPGLAYSTRDPDHRLNGALDNHLLDPARPGHLREWCERTGVLSRDPEALAANGGHYLRRGDFGTYVAEVLRERASVIRHHRALAVALRAKGMGYEVVTDDGARIASDAVVIATGNGRMAWPRAFAGVAGHGALIGDPFAAQRLGTIAREARVLLVGSGLTALDAISTLLRAGHAGPIAALSRHGVRPRPHRARVGEGSVAALLAGIEGPPPPHLREALAAGRVRRLAHALRERIAAVRREGTDWQVPFDEVRNVVWQFWPALPLAEKRRFLRHLRGWHDAHRFRAPPQNEAVAREAERRGRLSYPVGRLEEVRAVDGARIRVLWRDGAGARGGGDYDAVVNCTGLDPACGADENPFLRDLLAQGLARRDPTGIGFEVDAQCRPIARDGAATPRLRMVGPPTAGTFGDPLGVIFIAPQVRRMLPGLLAELAASRATA